MNKDDIQLRVAFDQVDTDSSGSIDLDELCNAMRALGREMPIKQVQSIMDEYDTDKSGEIDFDEFKDMMDGLKNKNKLSDDRIWVEIVRYFDRKTRMYAIFQTKIRSLEKLFGLMKVGSKGIDKEQFRAGMRRKSHFEIEFTDGDLDKIFDSMKTSKSENRIFRKDLKRFFRSNKF